MSEFLSKTTGTQEELNEFITLLEKETGMTVTIKNQEEDQATVGFCGEITSPDGKITFCYVGEVHLKVKP